MRRHAGNGTYTMLTPAERLQLLMEAEDRNDQSERDVLVGTIRRVTSTSDGPDPSFVALAEATHALGRALGAGAGPSIGWLNVLDLLAGPLHRTVSFLVVDADSEADHRFPFPIRQAAHDGALGLLKAMI